MNGNITVDVAGGPTGGAARLRVEFHRYLKRTGRTDVQVIGEERRVGPAWLLRREVVGPISARRVALNNVSFVTPGGQRWTLLRNALHFLTEDEMSRLEPFLITAIGSKTTVVRMAARRSDVLVVPCTSMAERIAMVIPSLHSRVVVRPHPVSADSIPILPRDPAILCPVLFESYKRMTGRLTQMLSAIDVCGDSSLQLRITATKAQVPADLANNSRIEFLGPLSHRELCDVWGRSRVIYFPTDLESFGYPLAEARVSGHPVIGLDTEQNREIAGSALCGFTSGDPVSLRSALALALTKKVTPDPEPFDPDTYFSWLLGTPR